MSQLPHDDRRDRRSKLPWVLGAVTLIGAVKAAAWFQMRARQPVTDEITRDRLQPRSRP